MLTGIREVIPSAERIVGHGGMEGRFRASRVNREPAAHPQRYGGRVGCFAPNKGGTASNLLVL